MGLSQAQRDEERLGYLVRTGLDKHFAEFSNPGKTGVGTLGGAYYPAIDGLGAQRGLDSATSRAIAIGGTGDYAQFITDLDAVAADKSQQTHPVRVAGVGRSLQSPAGLRSITAGRKGLKASRRPGLFFDPKDLVADENDRRRRANFTILGQPKRRTLLDSNRTPFP